MTDGRERGSLCSLQDTDRDFPSFPIDTQANLQLTAKFVKRSDPEKNHKRYPEQKRGKEPLTEERRIYRSLV